MGAENNLATIPGIYEASGTGDVEAIVAVVADDVDWAVDAEPVGSVVRGARGKDGVASFFADIASAPKVLDFAVEGMGASDNEVFSFLRFAVRMKSTGREASFHLQRGDLLSRIVLLGWDDAGCGSPSARGSGQRCSASFPAAVGVGPSSG